MVNLKLPLPSALKEGWIELVVRKLTDGRVEMIINEVSASRLKGTGRYRTQTVSLVLASENWDQIKREIE